MYFNKLLGNSEALEGIKKTIDRIAVRAVIVRNGKILLVRSNQGSYKLPGGGVEKGESFTAALLREVMEETGYTNCAVKRKIGMVTEKRRDQFARDTSFQMVSHYYICELTGDEKTAQQPDDYEWEQGFTAMWIDVDQAIHENHIVLTANKEQTYLQRENYVLAEIERNLNGWFTSEQ